MAKQTPEQRKSNVRLGIALASAAVLFGVGFVTKIILFGF